MLDPLSIINASDFQTVDKSNVNKFWVKTVKFCLKLRSLINDIKKHSFFYIIFSVKNA